MNGEVEVLADRSGQCSEATARALTDQLRQSLVLSENLLIETYQRRAWLVLGYGSWDAYLDGELGQVRIALPRERRREVVASMTEAGMSTRAIGAALGVDPMTVSRDRAGVAFATPADEPIDAEIVDDYTDLAVSTDEQFAAAIAEAKAEGDLSRANVADKLAAPLGPSTRVDILGTDGKTYTVTPEPAAQRRRPLPDAFWRAAYDLTKVTDRIDRLVADNRFPQHADAVSIHRGDLLRAIDALQAAVDRLPGASLSGGAL